MSLLLEAENAAIAALSYPIFKNKWLTCFEPKDRTKLLKLFKTCISKQMSEHLLATVATTKSTLKWKQKGLRYFYSDKNGCSFDAPMTYSRTFDAAFFCCGKPRFVNRYPEIKIVFINYNTPLPSSAADEHLFFCDSDKSAKESQTVKKHVREEESGIKM